MKKETVKIIIKYAIASIIAACFVLLNLSLRDFFKETELKEKYRMLADSFTIPGLIYVLLGLLIMLTNKGSLDALGYMVKRAVKMLVPMSKKDNMTYAEYKETKKGIHGYGFLFYIGAVVTAVGIVFTILFYHCLLYTSDAADD